MFLSLVVALLELLLLLSKGVKKRKKEDTVLDFVGLLNSSHGNVSPSSTTQLNATYAITSYLSIRIIKNLHLMSHFCPLLLCLSLVSACFLVRSLSSAVAHRVVVASPQNNSSSGRDHVGFDSHCPCLHSQAQQQSSNEFSDATGTLFFWIVASAALAYYSYQVVFQPGLKLRRQLREAAMQCDIKDRMQQESLKLHEELRRILVDAKRAETVRAATLEHERDAALNKVSLLTAQLSDFVALVKETIEAE